MTFRSSVFRPAVTAALLGLAGCASVVPSTAARLQALDPMTADPGQIEVALILPPGMQVMPGTAVLVLAAARGAETVSETFALAPRDGDGVAAPEGATVAAFGVTTADSRRMRDWQARIAGWKAEGAASGTISVGVGGCALGPGPAPDATGAVLIRLTADAPFRPLIRPTRLAALLGPDALTAMQPCDGAR